MSNFLIFTSQGFPELESQDQIDILVSRKMQINLPIKEAANTKPQNTS